MPHPSTPPAQNLSALLASLEELEKKATKGEWQYMEKPPASYEDHGYRSITSQGNHLLATTKSEYLRLIPSKTAGGSRIVTRKPADTVNDIEMIAALRNAAPLLLKLSKWAVEAKGAMERANKKLEDIKATLYGQNMGLTNWHRNGEAEPIDSFFENNDWEPETISTFPL